MPKIAKRASHQARPFLCILRSIISFNQAEDANTILTVGYENQTVVN